MGYVHSRKEKFLFKYWTDITHYWSTYSMKFIKLLLRNTLNVTCSRCAASRVLLESEGLRFNIIYINTLMIQSFKTEAKLFNSQGCSCNVIDTENKTQNCKEMRPQFPHKLCIYFFLFLFNLVMAFYTKPCCLNNATINNCRVWLDLLSFLLAIFKFHLKRFWCG
jgi:hypothetical protein